MDRDRNLFIVSGFISISLFTIFLLLFFYMLFSSKKADIFALKKDNYISISINTTINKTKAFKHYKKKQISKNSNEATSEISEPVDIENLFSDVWTRKIKQKTKKVKKVDAKRLQQIQKKSKLLNESKVENISNIVQSKVENPSISNEVNEYLARIQSLVYEHFFPPQNSQGYSVRAVIELSSIGKVMDFRILNYSANSSLNTECDKIKARLMGVMFPVNPNKRSKSYIIILKSKEEF